MLIRIFKTQVIGPTLKVLSNILIFVLIFLHWVSLRSSFTDYKTDEINSISLPKKNLLNCRQFLEALNAFYIFILFHRK